MKIGIFTYRQTPFISANTSIGYIIAKELSKKYEVCLIGFRQAEFQYNVEQYDGMPVRFLNKKIYRENYHLMAFIRRVLGERALYGCLSHGLNNIIEKEKIDALLFVTAPSDTAWIVDGAKPKIPIFLLQLDPFYNLGDKVNNDDKIKFLHIIRKVRHVFTTELLYEEYRHDPDLQEMLTKTSIAQFPKLDIDRYSSKLNYNEKPVLLYTGSLYHDIRNPSILVNLKKCVGDNCEIRFCGGCDCKEDEELLKQAGIVCFGYLSQEKLAEITASADILVNIGNLVHNQLGSKLLDYISTGKPILNITQIEHCPTEKVLEQYPLKYTVKATQIPEYISEIARFCRDTQDMRVSKEQILENYREYTPEFVAKQILQVLNKQ